MTVVRSLLLFALAAFAEIAKEVGAYMMVDIAHIAGLVAAGVHPSPVPHADFVTTTTHKTLRGPRSGIAMCRAEHAKALDSQVFPGLQGGPLMHVIAAKAVAFGEALRPEFKTYQQRIVDTVFDARLVVYEGAGHALYWEEPERLVQDVAAFAAQVLPDRPDGDAPGRAGTPSPPDGRAGPPR